MPATLNECELLFEMARDLCGGGLCHGGIKEHIYITMVRRK